MNRYDQITLAKQELPSFQEMSVAPAYMRQQEDALAASAAELDTFETDVLDADKSAVNQAVLDYQGKVNSYSDSLATEGFSQAKKRDILKLAAQKKQMESSEGLIGRGNAAKQAYLKNYEQLIKSKLDNDTIQAGLQSQLSAYEKLGGATEGASYTSFTGNLDPGIDKIIHKVASTIAKSKEQSQSILNVVRNKQGLPIDQTTQQVITPGNAIKIGVTNHLVSDRQVLSRLQQQSTLGLLKDPSGEPLTVNEYIDQIATNAQNEHAVNKVKINQKIHKPVKGSNGSGMSQGAQYSGQAVVQDRTLDQQPGLSVQKMDIKRDWGNVIDDYMDYDHTAITASIAAWSGTGAAAGAATGAALTWWAAGLGAIPTTAMGGVGGAMYGLMQGIENESIKLDKSKPLINANKVREKYADFSPNQKAIYGEMVDAIMKNDKFKDDFPNATKESMLLKPSVYTAVQAQLKAAYAFDGQRAESTVINGFNEKTAKAEASTLFNNGQLYTFYDPQTGEEVENPFVTASANETPISKSQVSVFGELSPGNSYGLSVPAGQKNWSTKARKVKINGRELFASAQASVSGESNEAYQIDDLINHAYNGNLRNGFSGKSYPGVNGREGKITLMPNGTGYQMTVRAPDPKNPGKYVRFNKTSKSVADLRQFVKDHGLKLR